MITNNFWINSNIPRVAAGIEDKFEVHLQPYKFKPLSFIDAAEYTATLIEGRFGYQGLYLGLSGGADSEFIARLFRQMGIPFTPIIVMSEINNTDIISAIEICAELELKPVVVRITEYEIIEYYFKKFFFNRNDGLTHVHQMMVADRAAELGGIAVLGETHIFDPDCRRSVVKAFKFIPDLYYNHIIPFYYYTLELTYAEMKEVRWPTYDDNGLPETAQGFKARVRGTKPRAKALPQYKINQSYHEAKKFLKDEWLYHDMGTPKGFIEQMENYIL